MKVFYRQGLQNCVCFLMTTVAIGVCLQVNELQAHPGLTDRRGCHTESDGTNYHCHPVDPESTSSPPGRPSKTKQATVQAEVDITADGAPAPPTIALDDDTRAAVARQLVVNDDFQKRLSQLEQSSMQQRAASRAAAFDGNAAAWAFGLALGATVVNSSVFTLNNGGNAKSMLYVSLLTAYSGLTTSSLLGIGYGLDSTPVQVGGIVSTTVNILLPWVLSSMLSGI